MCNLEEETHALGMLVAELDHQRDIAAHFRFIWHEDANKLGYVAECLAEALAWQPSDEEILPDPVGLAESAATRIADLERRLAQCQNARRATASTREAVYA